MAVEDTVTVVGLQAAEEALRLAAGGSAVVVAGTDAGAVGALVARLREAGARAAGFVGDPTGEGVVEMAGELFPGCRVVVQP
jgi:hypothetical protein